MTKYNAKKVVIDGIKFDSEMESEYYLFLKEAQKKGVIDGFELQPKFTLQESFKKRDILFRAIAYKADFIVYRDGNRAIIDVKGVETTEFKIKRKLFEKKFPDESLYLICKCPKKFGGGWIDMDKLKKLRKEEKKKNKKK